MRTVVSALTALSCVLAAALPGRSVEATWEYSVQVSATVQSSPPQITLTWPQDTYTQPNSYTVYRKAPSDTSWGAGVALPGTTTSYVDNNVTVGTAYEYQIVKVTSVYTSYGYILSGINLPMTDSRGKLLLVVDNTYAANLVNELAQLQQDLVGDGWTVIRLNVNRSDSVASVKSQIVAQYNADPANVKCVFLFGHVPVPYSGDIVPDGHTPGHQGAWPCDGYYGDMTGVWTDNSVNNTGAEYSRNWNVPGDGKFDQSTFPAPIKLMVGRVDFNDMPGLLWTGGPSTLPPELDLLRNYLNKDHKFRTKQFDLPRRAIVGDFFGARSGEAFAASGWRNFAPFFGANNVTMMPNQGTWVPTLNTTPYLWAYGCGAGSFASIAGVGTDGQYDIVTTPELYTNDIKAVFTMLFGSWLGDFDAEDNIMRCVLALPSYGLTCAWSGRPHWFFHHMAMGETIGYGARLTQNNGPNGLYQNMINTAAGQIHIALMGDPALRMHIVAPPANLRATTNGGSVTLNWSASADTVLGYHVYRAATNGALTRLTSSPVTGTTYTDTSGGGAANYMVRAVKLETSASGTYNNPSEGAFLAPLTTGGGVSGGNGSGSGSGTGSGSGSGTGSGNGGSNGGSTNDVVWMDDALPPGATPNASGGDSWTWVTSNPAPFSGTQSHQSAVASGMHQHFFTGASSGLSVAAGDNLVTYIYVDPANPPSEVMLQWNDGTSWEHRAYWGANLIAWGVAGTASQSAMGSMPAAGQWVRLQVPATQVGLAGSTVTGMAFTLYNGRATWDYSGKSVLSLTNTPPTTNNPPPITTNTPPTTVTNMVAWIDDALPTGAVPDYSGGDTWNWVSSNPSSFSGAVAHQSAIATGVHQHYFTSATASLPVGTTDTLVTYIYLDPANLPSEVMLQWNDGTSWEHRAYWGANNIGWGKDGTTSRHSMGTLPTAGQWVPLAVPASQVGLAGSTVSGMAFTLYNGRATWDDSGKSVISLTNTPPVSTNNPPPVTTNSPPTNAVVWLEDALPAGAVPDYSGGDSWTWISSNPTPFSGTKAHQSAIATGIHQHYFTSATSTLPVNSGDTLFTYVYLDPSNPPSEVMLQWNDGSSWEHRAYWGANQIAWGTPGTVSQQSMGSLPTAGQWVQLAVPASQVGLAGRTVSGMAFTLYNGRATWDYTGKSAVALTNQPPINPTNNPPINPTNSPPVTTNTPPLTNSLPNVSQIDYLTPQLPKVGDTALHILTPTLLELKLINTKQPDPAQVAQWNLVNSSSQFVAPPTSAFKVTVNGQQVQISGIGFKRRLFSAPLNTYDLRIENSLYLQLASPVSDNQAVQVVNTDGSLWSATTPFAATADPLRYSPAIHVNQEGYLPGYSKTAMIGYYAGSLGEVSLPASAGFKLVDANTGTTVYSGSLVQRADSGYTYSPTPYEQVYQADFSNFTTPGEYRLVVPGLGGSVPFLINDGIAMDFARAYALGLYHQRCGTATTLPYTRFTHGVCHAAPATVPSPQANFPFTWTTVANYAQEINANNPPQVAPALTSEAAQLYPFVNKGTIDVSGGHHDAGDYSKYTVNSAWLTHLLMFTADSLSGVSSLDNLGIPESGDGIPDVLQEAKWEADFLAKMQDADGGFYFLVYPMNREYESNVTPDHGDPQVVWPKTSSATAAAVAALAQCGSSPLFKKYYPQVASNYVAKAQLGFNFLLTAINKYGMNGIYQKITHYGDTFAGNDSLAWAACEMYLATGNPSYQQLLISWFDPSNPATMRWGWWRLYGGYGNAIRSFAFAPVTGRMPASQLDPTFLAKCQAQIAAAGDDALNWNQQGAYGSSFPPQTKAVQGAGWYFSGDQAFDMTVAYQLNPKPAYLAAILQNVNYEAGCNPVNSSYVTGLGWRRQRNIVSQWQVNDIHVLAPSGIVAGNVQGTFSWLGNYGSEMEGVSFPSDSATTAPYPFYDRWGDTWNVTCEMVHTDIAHSLANVAFLATLTSLKSQPWQSVAGQITVAGNGSGNQPVVATLTGPGIDLSGARITWEAQGQEPAYGATLSYLPQSGGSQWVEAEAQLPDGRRIFGRTNFTAVVTTVDWVDDSVPAGAVANEDGGDNWTWVNVNPAPFSGSLAHQSAIVAGEHQHYFANATTTMTVGSNDVLFTYIYLDPANLPSEVMLQWNDGTSWEHRAYWGANNIAWGTDGTASRLHVGALPAAGQWVRLEVQASQVGLAGATVNGMGFTLYGGRATWDASGRTTQLAANLPSVMVLASAAPASRIGPTPGTFTVTRTGDTSVALAINYTLGGTAVSGLDYQAPSGLGNLTIPIGAGSAALTISPLPTTNLVGAQSVVLTLGSSPAYSLGQAPSATLALAGNTLPVRSLKLGAGGATLTWSSSSNRLYRVAFKTNLNDSTWTLAGNVTATNTSSSWIDSGAAKAPQRFYLIAQVN